MLEEIHHFLQLVFAFVRSRDIGESTPVSPSAMIFALFY
jgi:hypothetical protein